MKSAMMTRSMSTMRTRYLLPLALGLAASLTMTLPAYAQQIPEQIMRTITVTGQGSEEIPTTITQVRLGVEVQGRTAEEVQRESARRSAAVVQLLRSRNVQKLQTTGIRLNPVYSYENNTQRLTGYSATNTVSFEIATEQAGTILDDAVEAGASQIEGVSFIATDEAIAVARQQALREATQEARQQAQAVLESLNLSEQEIVGIQVNGASAPPPPPYPLAARVRSEAANATTPVIGGEQEVQASVTLQIRY